MKPNLGRVLVVDDDPHVLRACTRMLQYEGWSVVAVEHGRAGVVAIRDSREPFDVVVCDVNMPELDGIGFVRAIKAKNETRKIPVIFLTASNDPRHMVDGINVGARFYLTKPFEMNELVWKINRVLSANGSGR